LKAITFGTLEAKEGQGDDLLKSIQEHMALVGRQRGLLDGYIARAKGNGDKFLVVSIWESEEARQEAMSKLSGDPGAARGFLEMMQLLNGQPDFGNYLVESICKGTDE